jgi:hypothetical protein
MINKGEINMFENYQQSIESLTREQVSDAFLNAFIETVALDERITTDEYRILYDMLMNKYKSWFDFYNI